MASESTEWETMALDLPAGLDEWLDEQSAALGVDREAMVIQLLASYRATAELEEGSLEGGDLPLTDSIEEVVEDSIEGSVGERVDELREEIGDRIDGVEADHQEKLEDVRERVVQLKRELDGKAGSDHDHEEFERLAEIADEVDEIERSLGEVIERLEEAETDLAETDERLETVAWVVNDLRDAYESQTSIETVDRIKRTAAKEDIERAKCENCDEGVAIGLLTEPECPHCQATVTNVEQAAGFFSKPRLLTASQLESDG